MFLVMIVIVVLVLLVVWILKETSGSYKENERSCSSEINEYAYGKGWPKPNHGKLWDSLDYFTRLAEVQSELSTDMTVVSLDLYYEDVGNTKRGDFEIGYFDIESAQAIYSNKIPHLKDLLIDKSSVFRFKGNDVHSTALTCEPEKICEIVLSDAPHAQITYNYYSDKGKCLVINFKFPSRH